VNFAEIATRYAQDVVTAAVLAGRYVKAACQRHLDDLERSATDPAWPYVFDAGKAERVCAFISLLPHVEGEWAKPKFIDGRWQRERIKLEPWQVFFFACVFGWVHRETGLRRFARAYLEVARKNAKSTTCAGAALYTAVADNEEGGQVYSAATKKDQAKIVWSIAKRMVELEPDFRALGVGVNARAIFHQPSGSRYEPLGRDSDTLDGLNSHCFIADELHAHKDRGLWDVLDSSTGARAQSLGIGITTAGSNTAGVCFEQRGYLISILNATLKRHGGMGYKQEGADHEDDRYFGLIYTLDHGYSDDRADDDWADEATWIKANPNLGISVSIDDMRAKCTKAKASTASQAEFRTKHCNQWIASESAWMDMTQWNACADLTLTSEQFAHEECVIALDAAFKQDIFAKIKLLRRGEEFYVFGKYWMPRAQLDNKKLAHLSAWAESGHIHVCDDPVVDVEPIKQSLRADADLHVVKDVAYDPWSMTQFAGEMLVEGFQMVELRQNTQNLSEPMKAIADLVTSRKLHHNGDPVLAWMIGNVVCHYDAKDNVYPRRDALNQWKKIDGAIALIMAMNRMLANPVHYASEEVLFV
jgi:phage terminase large subunit-like protein